MHCVWKNIINNIYIELILKGNWIFKIIFLCFVKSFLFFSPYNLFQLFTFSIHAKSDKAQFPALSTQAYQLQFETSWQI